jgi:DNA polymerase III epsilon subunit-like protein
MFIDLETTGLPDRKDYNNLYNPTDYHHYDTSRIVEIAYIITDINGNIIKEYTNLVIPYDYDILNSKIHGITMFDAISNGIELNDVFDEILKDLVDINTIVAHNISFDENVLLAECYRHNKVVIIQEIMKKNKLCTMAMGKKYMKQNKNPKLVELYKYLFNKDVVGNHRALVDTKLCMECFFKIS